ncbi:MAG TPA: hypothetical protein VGO57_15475 [Verrucomicrobiae bacterium]
MGHTPPIKIAAWAKAEQRKLRREEQRESVRGVFGLLFCLAVLVYIFSDHSSLQKFIQAKIYPRLNQALMVRSNAPSSFKEGALKHEHEVDEINNP